MFKSLRKKFITTAIGSVAVVIAILAVALNFINFNKLEERIDILEKSILHKAFKGELGTQNSSDESALNLLKSIL